MNCLQQYILEGERNRNGLEASNRDIRDKADKAMELKGKIFNVEFLLLLAGLSDIYEQFGAVVQVTQMVHLLPHQRYDLYQKAVKRLTAMADCLLDHDLCKNFQKVCQENPSPPQAHQVQSDQVADGALHVDPLPGEDPVHLLQHDDAVLVLGDDEDHQPADVPAAQPSERKDNSKRINKKKAAAEKCPWTGNHASKASLKKDNTIQNLSVTDRYGVPAAGLQVVTRRTYQDILANNKEDVEAKTDQKL